MSYPSDYYNYPPPPNGGYARDRYNPAANGGSAGGTVVPPSAGHSPPPQRVAPARPHTAQPAYGYGPPPSAARASMYGVYGGGYPGYYAGFPPPPVAYAESMAPPPIPAPPLPPPQALPPAGPGQGGPSAQQQPDPHRQHSATQSVHGDDNSSDKGKNREDQRPHSQQASSPPPQPPLSNAAAVAKAEEMVPGIGNQLPNYDNYTPEERDKHIQSFIEKFLAQYPAYSVPPPPPHYPYYPPPPHHYPPHPGYLTHMTHPPPPHSYGYHPLPPANGNGELDRHSEGEEPEERDSPSQVRAGGAPIMPGGFAHSPIRETPPPPAGPPPPAQPAGTPSQAPKKKKSDPELRSGSMPPPKIRPPKSPEVANKTKPGTAKKEAKEADLKSPTPQLGPNGEGDVTIHGHAWGVYLFDHTNQKKGHTPVPRPRLKSLLRALATWIIKEIEPKDSMVIPPNKLIKFYKCCEVEEEPFNWNAFISSLAPRSLSELYQQLECHHFLIPPITSDDESPKGNDYSPFEPTIPALTPMGFERWMVIQITAYPEREAKRLQKLITEFPIHDVDRNERFPKSLPRKCLPAKGDGSVENAWDEAVMSVRRGGYISNGTGDEIDFGYGPDSELVRGRERRPYAKSNVASSRGSSREREDDFVPAALTRKRTDQKYANVHVPFDDLRVDPTKEEPIERKRKPYVSINPPGKNAREVVHPPTSGGAGGTSSATTRLGGNGFGDRPGSHDTNGSGGSGSGGRNGGGGVELNTSIAGSTATTAKGGDYNGSAGVKTPEQPKNPRDSRLLEDLHKRYGSTSTTSPSSAHPNSAGAQFPSPQGRHAAAAAAGGGVYTPISPLAATFPELHHYPSSRYAPHIRDPRGGSTIPPPPPDISPPEPRPSRRRSISAADAQAELFGGVLPGAGGSNAGSAYREFEGERLEYHARHGGHGHHHSIGGHGHGHVYPAPPPPPPAGYYRGKDRDRDRDREREFPGGWDDDEGMGEMYYRVGGPLVPGDRDRERAERERDRERERELARRESVYRGRREEEEEGAPRRRTARSRGPAEFRGGGGGAW